MNFWAWANRRSESVVEFALKLILAILIVVGFGSALATVLNRVSLDQITQPPLTIDACGEQGVAGIVRAHFVDAYNAQAWSSHLLTQDVSLTKPSAIQLRSDIERVDCTGVMVVGMQHAQDRRIVVNVNYSVARQAGSPDILVETSYRGADFIGRGFSGVARRGTRRD